MSGMNAPSAVGEVRCGQSQWMGKRNDINLVRNYVVCSGSLGGDTHWVENTWLAGELESPEDNG